MSKNKQGILTGVIVAIIFFSGFCLGKFLFEPIEKPVEIKTEYVDVLTVEEVFVDIDIVNKINKLNVQHWSLTRRFNGNYNLIVIIDDNFSSSINNVQLFGIKSHLKYIEEMQSRLSE